MMTTGKSIGAAVLTTGVALGVLAAMPATTQAATTAATAATAATVTSQAQASAQAQAQAQAQALGPWPVLRQGTNSAWPKVTVRSLQYLLAAHGAKLVITGTFDTKTRAAVINFQRSHHLAVDGVAGSATWRALIPKLKLGSTGPAVRAVQDQANFRNGRDGHSLNVDGIYGKKTQAWVRGFQHAMAQEVRGFTVNGVVDTITWHALVTESLAG
jgi:peptidoglycan hydrolase-like protein with peptidoglycan-binding domain